MRSFTILFILLAIPGLLSAQATINVESRDILTYPYGDPNPVPVLTEGRSGLYPYHTFSGYSLKGQMQKHTVVKLENKYIEVYVLPADGGKVWGAIEKSTGKEFIYRNEVIKYRNISMRGPWTSGGIEFNFGIIGHSPSTASPVDYLTRENADGSVSCIVGNTDLPSRTDWRVEIRLPKDKAYFETRVLWNNPSPLPQPYYNWMTAAAVVSNDLVLQYPGNRELGHPGNSGPWPADTDGRSKARYTDNVLKPSMSYHVVGEYNDFMGGYYMNSGLGFGHWALYDEMPGRKAWLWSQSRSGAIWEDLLTDHDGQYMEFQAGRMLNQYSPDPSEKTPITRTGFAPGATDQWREIWFPVKEIGGFKEVSPLGVLNVTEKFNRLEIGINALTATQANIIVKAGDSVVYRKEQSFIPMEVFSHSTDLPAGLSYEIIVEGMDLHYTSNQRNNISRPFVTETPIDKTTPSSLYFEGMELKENRSYSEAKKLFLQCLQKDPYFIDAMAALVDLYYRSALYDSALIIASRALQLDTYHPAVNYLAGITYLAKGDLINALESLGWAARSMEYRSKAYELMAAIEVRGNDFQLAGHYANQSLDFNRYNLNSRKILAVLHRLKGEPVPAETVLTGIKEIDPLDHWTDFERYLNQPTNENLHIFTAAITNEFPVQTWLETAIFYETLGLKSDALALLEKAPKHPLISIWKAWLRNDPLLLNEAITASPAFVFPYRTETLELLTWAAGENKNWKFRYYLALNLWAIQREEEARELLLLCGNEPDYAPFYLARAAIMVSGNGVLADLQKANQIAPGEWRTHYKLIECLEKLGKTESALHLSTIASKKFGTNPVIMIQYAAALLLNGQPLKCIKTMEGMVFLPSEGSDEGRVLYEQARISLALDLIDANRYKEALVQTEKAIEWPENLGAGKPYDPDNRVQNYLAAYCLKKMNRQTEATHRQNAVLEYNATHIGTSPVYNLLALQIYRERGETRVADDLLQRIMKSDNIDEPVQRWIAGKYNLDEAKIGEFEGPGRDMFIEIINRILGMQ
jgi:tetratricopeptide (TPR) repeat protein